MNLSRRQFIKTVSVIGGACFALPKFLAGAQIENNSLEIHDVAAGAGRQSATVDFSPDGPQLVDVCATTKYRIFPSSPAPDSNVELYIMPGDETTQFVKKEAMFLGSVSGFENSESMAVFHRYICLSAAALF
jgi:hypothetical protein